MSTLYITEQGAKLRKTSRRLVVEKSGQVLLEVPAHEVDRVLIFGNTQISTQALNFLLDSGIDVSLLSMNGKLRGRLVPAQSKNVFLRLAQYNRAKDNEFKLQIAKIILRAKMKNQRTLIQRYRRNHPELDFAAELKTISECLSKLAYCKTIASAMGLEGCSTSAYFRCFAQMLSCNFSFNKRTRHPPLDPVNALLSLGYALITNEIASLVESAGFDPFIGFLHGFRYGRQSLPLDLVEEFRHPVIDTLTLSLVNKRVFRECHFEQQPDGSYYLTKEAFKCYLNYYQERLEKPFLDRNAGGHVSYRTLFRNQVTNMERAVLNKDEYQPFLVR